MKFHFSRQTITIHLCCVVFYIAFGQKCHVVMNTLVKRLLHCDVITDRQDAELFLTLGRRQVSLCLLILYRHFTLFEVKLEQSIRVDLV